MTNAQTIPNVAKTPKMMYTATGPAPACSLPSLSLAYSAPEVEFTSTEVGSVGMTVELDTGRVIDAEDVIVKLDGFGTVKMVVSVGAMGGLAIAVE